MNTAVCCLVEHGLAQASAACTDTNAHCTTQTSSSQIWKYLLPACGLGSCAALNGFNPNVHATVQEAAKSAGRHISVLRSAGAAPDHPIDPGYPEGAYLKNLLLLVR